jgi:hypothetical protein
MITEGADPMPMELQPDGLGLRHSLPAGADFKYSFRLVDAAHGFAYDDVWRLVRVISDNVPEVKLLEPAGDGPATIRKKLRLVVRATDDYGLSKIRLSCSVNGSQDTKHVLGPLKGRQIEAAFDWTPGTATPDLKDGDVVTVAVEVCDARDETDSRWGRSAERRLSICSDAAYLRWLADELDEQRAGIHEAWAEEQTALSAIRQIKGQEMPAKAEQGGK